jgi:hypothetical protein
MLVGKILEEMPGYKKLHDDIKAMKLITVLGGKEIRKKLKTSEEELSQMISFAEKFSEYFSDHGWILYDSISSNLIERSVKKYDESGFAAAEEVLIDYYKNEVGSFLYQLKNGNQELSIRYEHIKRAYEDHKSERYYASIPQFLMIIDGAVNDYTKNQGFFAEGIELDAWDCLVGCSDGLKKLKEMYGKSRKKTNMDPILLPYRNGILHGRDLNYANEVVSCKCIVLLFAIHDWMIYKKSEHERKGEYKDSLSLPSWSELFTKIKENNDIKERIDAWEKVEIIIGQDIPRKGNSDDYENFPYVQKLVCALQAWKDKNYGKLALYFDYLFKHESNVNLRPKKCRLLFQNKEFKEFKLVEVEDRAIYLKRVLVEAKWVSNNSTHIELLEFGVSYQKEKNRLAIPPDDEGEWVIIPWNVQGIYKP